MHATIDDNHLKDLMKTALMELLEEHPAMLRGLMAEALEDMTRERPRGGDRDRDREDDDYEDDDFPRRHTARPSRRSRMNASAGFSGPGPEDIPTNNPRRAANNGATAGYSTAGPEGIGPTGRWNPAGETATVEDPQMGAATPDYGAAFGSSDPFFRKPPLPGGAYGSAAPSSPFQNRQGAATSPVTPFTGAAYLSRGLSLLINPGLRRYVVLPLASSVLLFSFAIWWGMGQFGAFNGWAHGYLPFWLIWIEWLLWPIFTIAPVVVVFYFFTLITNIIAAPFNSLLAEKVSRQISGLPMGAGPGFGTAILRVPSSLKEEWRKSVWFIVRALIFVVLFFIPLVNLVAPLLWALFSAWSLALKYLDYPIGNQGLEFDETRALAAENRWLVLGFGVAVLAMTIVPVLNFVAMPAAVAGASALWTDHMALRRNMSI
ncbi:CysZ protein [Gammaproteobacteria bacterium]